MVAIFLAVVNPLVLPYEWAAILMAFGLVGVATLRGGRVPSGIGSAAGPLLALLAVGWAGAVGHDAGIVARDTWLVGRLVLAVMLGYIVAYVGGERSVVAAVTAAALVMTAHHLLQFVLDPALLQKPTGHIRREVSRGYYAPVVVLGAAWAGRRLGADLLPWGGAARTGVIALSAGSLLLSFSRTLWVCLIVTMVVAYWPLGQRSARRRRAGRVLVGISLVVLSAAVAAPVLSQNEHLDGFVEKALRSGAEMTIRNQSTREGLNENWRGYEAYRAVVHYAAGTPWEYAMGDGFGTVVDLGVTIKLDGRYFREVPVFHNGYATLLVKTGAVGIALYLLFGLGAMRRGVRAARRRERPPAARAFALLVAGTALSGVVATLTDGGLINPHELDAAAVVIGAGLVRARRSAAPDARLAVQQSPLL
jgi:hypothetical protein